MTLAPVIFPTITRTTFYQNGASPVPIVLTSPICRAHTVNFQRCAPATCRASLSIMPGELLADVEPLTNIRRTDRYNFKFQTSNAIETFVSQLRGCWIKIETLTNVRSRDNETVGTDFTVRETLFQNGEDTDSLLNPDQWEVIFVGKIYSMSRKTKNWKHPITIEAADLSEWLNADGFFSLPVRVDNNRGFSGYRPIYQNLLPDFNEVKAGIMSPNKDTAGNKDITFTSIVSGKTVRVNANAFYGEDPNTAQGAGNLDFWTGQDIVLECFDYVNSYNEDLLSKIGVDITVNDKTNGLYKIVETVSSRLSIWETICKVVNKDRCLTGYWTYGGDGSSTTATFNIVFMNDEDLAGFTATESYDYTIDNGDPVWAYSPAPLLTYSDVDKCVGVRVETEPLTLVYTFNLKDNFDPAFPTGDGPGAIAIADGGTQSIWWNRYQLNVHTLNKITDYHISSAGSYFEGWNPVITPIGVKFDGSGALTYLNMTDPNDFLGFAGTCKITTNIPFSNEDGAADSNSVNTPAFLFLKNNTDDIQKVPFNAHFLNNIVQTKQPEGSEEIFKESGTDNYFMTIGVQGTPALYRYFPRASNFTNNDDAVIVLRLKYSPCVILNNTVLGNDPDGSGKPVIVNNVSGIGTLRCANAGEDLQKIWDDMEVAGKWWLRDKVKAEWSIKFIDTTPLAGKFLSTMDVNGPINPDDSEIISGIGDERFIRTQINAIITGITFDFDAKHTHYETNFAFYKGVK